MHFRLVCEDAKKSNTLNVKKYKEALQKNGLACAASNTAATLPLVGDISFY